MPVYLHRDDLFLYEGTVQQGAMFGFKVSQPPPIDVFYDMTPIHFGDYEVRVHHTPGHCPGGVCLQIGHKGTPGKHLFVGDTLFAGSIGRTDLPGGDYDVLMRVDHRRAVPARRRQDRPPRPRAGYDDSARADDERFRARVFRREALVRFLQRDELNASHLQAVAGRQARGFDALAVHVRAVRAFEIRDLQLAANERGHAAVHARDERGIDDEIGAGGAADRAFIAWQDAEGFLRLTFGHGPQDPHWC